MCTHVTAYVSLLLFGSLTHAQQLTGTLQGHVYRADGGVAEATVVANCGEKQKSGIQALPIYIPHVIAGVAVWDNGPTTVPQTHKATVTDDQGLYSIKLPATPPLTDKLTGDKSCLVMAFSASELKKMKHHQASGMPNAYASWVTIPPNGVMRQDFHLKDTPGFSPRDDEGPLGPWPNLPPEVRERLLQKSKPK